MPTFDAAKEQAIELLSNGNLNYEEIAKTVKVDVRTLRTWRRDPEFAAEVRKRALDLLKESVPAVYSILSEKSIKNKDLAAIRLFLECVDRSENDVLKAAEGQITFTWGKKEQLEEEEVVMPPLPNRENY